MQKLFIGGKWDEAKSGATLPVIDPSTGESYDTIPRGAARRYRRRGERRARRL